MSITHPSSVIGSFWHHSVSDLRCLYLHAGKVCEAGVRQTGVTNFLGGGVLLEMVSIFFPPQLAAAAVDEKFA